jgi:hypothetical protein
MAGGSVVPLLAAVLGLAVLAFFSAVLMEPDLAPLLPSGSIQPPLDRHGKKSAGRDRGGFMPVLRRRGDRDRR